VQLNNKFFTYRLFFWFGGTTYDVVWIDVQESWKEKGYHVEASTTQQSTSKAQEILENMDRVPERYYDTVFFGLFKDEFSSAWKAYCTL
jgi:hypothetical protein